MKIVLDTNAILSSISTYSPYRIIREELLNGTYDLLVNYEILIEYEEKLQQNFGLLTSQNFKQSIYNLPNVIYTPVYFNLTLIYPDYDDNKFVDCAFAGQADFLVTNDKDFNRLKKVSFPKINLLTIKEFTEILSRK